LLIYSIILIVCNKKVLQHSIIISSSNTIYSGKHIILIYTYRVKFSNMM